MIRGFLSSSNGKEPDLSVGDLGSIPELGRSPGEGHGYPLQYSGLENSKDTVHGVAKSRTRLSDFHFTSLHKIKQNLKSKVPYLLESAATVLLLTYPGLCSLLCNFLNFLLPMLPPDVGLT